MAIDEGDFNHGGSFLHYYVPATTAADHDESLPVNHKEALELAYLRRTISNLARCYIELAGWRLIDTAPKDGTQILGYATGADGRPMYAIVYWGCYTHKYSARRSCAADCPEADCEFRWLGTLGTRYGVPFTDWLPLVPPPR